MRAEMPAKYLPGRCVNLEDMQDERGVRFDTDLGTVIMLYPGTTGRGHLMRVLQAMGYRVLFECDDNYTIHSDAPETSDWRMWPTEGRSSYQVASAIARAADGVICASPALADVYGRLNENVFVARNCVDPTDWPEPPEQTDGKLRVGWAASSSHHWDAPLLKPAFDWLIDRPDVQLVVYGFRGFGDQIEFHEWTDSLADYRQRLSGLDVMLCPLRRSPFSDCRSDLKALEAVMAGGCAVVADSPAYDQWADKTHVVAGAGGWLDIVKHLYSHRDEIAELKRLQRAYVLAERTISSGVAHWAAAL